MKDLVDLCERHGIASSYVGIDGIERDVSAETLRRLADAFGLEDAAPLDPDGIARALKAKDPPRCHVPAALETRSAWGLTCQLPALVSDRNLGMGDFADLAAFCRLAADQGADFVGLNPLHALFYSDPARISPFSPSDRRFLNPRYLAPDWIEGFDGLTAEDAAEAARLRATPLLDAPGVHRLKDRLLRGLFGGRNWSGDSDFANFRARGGDALEGHALFEALSAHMTAQGHGAGWPGWPEALQDRSSTETRTFAQKHRAEIDYHLWLQWQAARQVERVHQQALDTGMAVGLYLDFAVGAAPDGSAAWADPALTVPGAAIGAPPDFFNENGQDWGLAPLSPVRLAELDCGPLAEIMEAVMRPAGAIRIDHAMSLARLWLIPSGMNATEGAYVHYPLSRLLARLAGASQQHSAMVIGEDLGVVPDGFRDLMKARAIHAYKVFFFERSPTGFADPKDWPEAALACLATHDTATIAGWLSGYDIALRRKLGMLSGEGERAERKTRAEDLAAVRKIAAPASEHSDISARLHAHIADSPCRLAALQVEDALGIVEQVNVPGTTDQHPNWRRRLPVTLDALPGHPGFRAHTAAMRSVRPK